MNRWYVRNILQYPRDKNGNLSVPIRMRPDEFLDEEQKLRRAYKDWDFPDWKIEPLAEVHSQALKDFDRQQIEAATKLAEFYKNKPKRSVSHKF